MIEQSKAKGCFYFAISFMPYYGAAQAKEEDHISISSKIA